MSKFNVLFFGSVFFMIVIYGISFKEKERKLEGKEVRIPVKATFSSRESTEDPNDTCFQLEGSRRSFYNDKNYNEKTVFEIVQVFVDEGNNCVRKILADGNVFELPKEDKHCIDYKLPVQICSGRGCVRVYDFCL